MNRLFRICVSVCCIEILAGVAGCDSKPPSPPPKAEIIRREIVAPAESVKPLPSSPVEPSAKTPSQGVAAISSPAPAAQMSGGVSEPAGRSYDPAAFMTYNPAGKVDPFVPLIKDESPPAKTAQSQNAKKEKRIPTSPLELIDLSQLKLTAVLHTPSGNKAMVEESNGKGYVIGVGSYIGTHSGKVVSILNDKVVVEEETEDALGNTKLHKTELKFQKPSGEF